MTIILLGSGNKKLKRIDFSKTLIRLLYAVHDLDVALVRFDTSYSDDVTGMDDILSEFDAHVGDCGCHLRAQMFWSLIEHYRDAKSREWIGNVIEILRDIKRKIAAMYCDIRRLNGDSRLLGFSSSILLADIFDRIGCKPLFAILDNYSSEIGSDDAFDISTASDHGITSIQSTTGDRHRMIKADKWNLSDYRMVARFLSYCRSLSLHKTAVLEPGTIRIRSRLDPLFASSETQKQLDRLNLIDGDLLSNFIAHDERPSRRALVQDIENMQIYLTQLTCDWMVKLSLEMSLGQPIQKLLKSSVRVSVRQLHCMAAYSSMLVIHFEWLVKRTPLFLLVRRFCAQGYHNTFYRVSVNSDAIHRNIEAVRQDNSKIVEVGSADWFSLTAVPLNSALTQDWAHQPHVILISNSIDGSMADFYLRWGNENQSGPHNDPCLEYDDFVKNEFATINFSQAIMQFFSAHDQYPFDLPENEPECDVIEKIVDSTLGRDAATTYHQIVDEAHGCGARCTPLGFLNFQHIFVQLPSVIIHQTMQIILRNEKPSLYGYHWADITDATAISNCSTK